MFRRYIVKDADLVLAVQPPALDVIDNMKAGAILVSFIYAHKDVNLVHRLVKKKITCFAMEMIPRICKGCFDDFKDDFHWTVK